MSASTQSKIDGKRIKRYILQYEEKYCENIFVRYHLKGHIKYIFAILFFKSKKEHFWKQENAFYFT